MAVAEGGLDGVGLHRGLGNECVLSSLFDALRDALGWRVQGDVSELLAER